MYISDVAKQSNLSIHTLRFYEKIGLLKNIARDSSGRRSYSQKDLEWLIWIQRLKSTGMSLEKIKQFSGLRMLGDESMPARKNMLVEHAAKLRADIEDLQKELAIVDYKIELYSVYAKKP